MAKKEKIISEEMIAEEVRQFCQQQKTLMLASSSPDNAQPLVSYAPFIEEGGDFFLFLSVLSGLGDFNLYCLTPVDGNYVRGFGQAYELRDAKYPVLTTQ